MNQNIRPESGAQAGLATFTGAYCRYMGATTIVVDFRHRVDRRSIAAQADEALVADVRAGDDGAFEAIYDRYARGVLAFCVHMLGNNEAAEDALQLTFVSAYRALRAGDNDISLRAWLYTIARNRCLSELRSRRDADAVDALALERPFPDGLADQVQRREELREMVEDMQRLPADQRAALVLFELGDHSHHEIAAVLGVRREKVKALIFQAREGLLRGRHARNRPCLEIREQLATVDEKIPSRGMTRAHIERCPSCAAFEHEVRRQRVALALILPVIPAAELKTSVLGSALGGTGAAAVGGSGAVGGGGGALVAGGTTAAGGATGTGGVGGIGAVVAGTGTTSSAASAGASAASLAAVASAPVSAVATGLTTVGADYAVGGISGLGAGGVVAKILTAAAIATGAAGAVHATSSGPAAPSPSASVLNVQMPSVIAAFPSAAPGIASAANGVTPAALPSSGEVPTSLITTPSSGSRLTSTETTTTTGAGDSASTSASVLTGAASGTETVTNLPASVTSTASGSAGATSTATNSGPSSANSSSPDSGTGSSTAAPSTAGPGVANAPVVANAPAVPTTTATSDAAPATPPPAAAPATASTPASTDTGATNAVAPTPAPAATSAAAPSDAAAAPAGQAVVASSDVSSTTRAAPDPGVPQRATGPPQAPLSPTDATGWIAA